MIINAWGGFAYDVNRGDLITFGGGHADYCGNDVYRFRLSSLRWERAGLSSRMDLYKEAEGIVTAIPADGLANAPMTSHMYDQLTFLPRADRMIFFGGRPFWDGTGAPTYSGARHPNTGPWLFDPSRANADRVVGSDGSAMNTSVAGGYMWQNRQYAPNHPGAFVPPTYGIQASSATVCGGARDVVYMRASTTYQDGSMLIRYDVPDVTSPALDTLNLVGATSNHGGEGDMAVDPVQKVAVLMGDSANRPLTFWDLSTEGPANPLRSAALTNADGTFTYDRLWGMDFDARRGRYLLWRGGTHVWELRAPAGSPVPTTGWTIRRIVATGGPTAAPWPSGGALGKWKFAPDLDVFIGLREAPNGDVWVYKPSGWVDPALP